MTTCGSCRFQEFTESYQPSYYFLKPNFACLNRIDFKYFQCERQEQKKSHPNYKSEFRVKYGQAPCLAKVSLAGRSLQCPLCNTRITLLAVCDTSWLLTSVFCLNSLGGLISGQHVGELELIIPQKTRLARALSLAGSITDISCLIAHLWEGVSAPFIV